MASHGKTPRFQVQSQWRQIDEIANTIKLYRFCGQLFTAGEENLDSPGINIMTQQQQPIRNCPLARRESHDPTTITLQGFLQSRHQEPNPVPGIDKTASTG